MKTYEFWFGYVKPKNGKNVRIFYMDTDSFKVHIKTDGKDEQIAKDVKTRFDISNFELDRQLPKEKNKNVTELMKDKLGEKIKKQQ